jgi:hypothetical protein
MNVNEIVIMTFTDLIGFSGVFLLLLAFFFNLIGKLRLSSPYYLILKFAGSSLACLASVMLQYIPFIILEGIWAAVSLFALLKPILKNS